MNLFNNLIISFDCQVHSCYGEQLGLTSDDDDSYVDPTEDAIDLKLSADSISEVNSLLSLCTVFFYKLSSCVF